MEREEEETAKENPKFEKMQLMKHAVNGKLFRWKGKRDNFKR